MGKNAGKMESFLFDESGALEVNQQINSSYSSGVVDELDGIQKQSTASESEE